MEHKETKIYLHDIAGFCPEEAIWKMLADVSSFMLQEPANRVLSPDSIVVDGDVFLLAAETPSPEGKRPETDDIWGNDLVWSLGATAFFAATGHVLFGGHGYRYQREHPQVVLPSMPKAYQALTPLVQRCLCAEPSERISLKQLCAEARRGHVTCAQQQRTKAAVRRVANTQHSTAKERWPEEMEEIG